MGNLGIDGALTFFYYNDLQSSYGFYEEVMGFEKVMDKEWVKLYRIKDGAHVGLVSKERGSHKPSPIKPVRLQVMVEDAEAWFEYLREKGVETDREEIHVGTELNIKAFAVKDPEGYTIEICEYTTPYGL